MVSEIVDGDRGRTASAETQEEEKEIELLKGSVMSVIAAELRKPMFR